MVMLAALPSLCINFERVMRVVIFDPLALPTVGFLAESVVEDDFDLEEALSKMSSTSPLVRYRLLELSEHPRWPQGKTPRLHAIVTVPQRVLDFIRGQSINTRAHALHDAEMGLDDVIVDERLKNALIDALRRPQPRVHLVGPQGVGRRTLLLALGQQMGQKVLEVSLEHIAGQEGEQRAAEVLREASMFGALLLLRGGQNEVPLSDAVQALLAGYPGGVVITSESRQGAPGGLGITHTIEFPLPDSESLCRYWEHCLTSANTPPERARDMASLLSQQYRVAPGTIKSTVDACKAKGPLTTHRLLKAVREQFHHGLGWLADPVEVTMSLDDVVMTEGARRKTDEILLFARHAEQVFESWGFAQRGAGGRGLSALFSGPPGTGKTLVAGVIAQELGRMLYRVDLSRIVDKYIGETEKNLGRVFDEAERAQAVLLFDEADSLFAKRTEVRSSNDRYANLEVGFLLQRMDDFAGVSILTTNLAQSIDEAFQRRIRFKVEFPMPDEAMRGELWQKLMPPRAPVAKGIRWHLLGEGFELSGGHIRNAILRAAMMAAGKAEPISERMLWEAALDECREMGVLVADGLMQYDDV